ncbi:MAG TPA: prepilin-type N-terminal cleavage/methylation domain-containing protein [Candidatus Saccharimonadales bacterium]
MLQNIKNNKGFTIVETLIVLAIAAVIIIIVLLAVPALQRTSRNSNIKTDATTFGGGVSEYESANGGALPTGISDTTGAVTFTGATATKATISGNTITSTATTPTAGTPTSITYSASAGANCTQNGTSCNTVTPGHIAYSLGASCPTPNTGSPISISASASSIAILYPIEISGGGSVGCYQN